MARPESEAKAGFFPAHPEAVAGICEHLTTNPDRPLECRILDPCAGEGLAIRQIADHLQLPYDNVWCVELDEGRADKCRENLPGAHVLGPASFLGTNISAGSFGLIYCNPPFSHEMGGGRREEQSFAERCARLLHPKGVLALVLPINAICGNGGFVCDMDSRFEGLAVYRFPDEHRKFREIAIFARKRQARLSLDLLTSLGCLHALNWRYGYGNMAPENFPKLGGLQPEKWIDGQPSFDREGEVRIHYVPWSWKPSRFEKAGYTDDRELKRDLLRSPLNGGHAERVVEDCKVVPMSISKNHLSMLLASGELDGCVYFFDADGREVVGLRHVVRGVTAKRTEYNEAASSVTVDEEDECLRVKQVYSQHIDMHTNAFDAWGKLHKFTEADDPEGGSKPDWTRKQQAREEPAEATGNPRGYPDDYDYELAAQLARMNRDNGCTPAEEAQAQARLKCMREGKTWDPSEWTQFIEEYAEKMERSEAA